MKELLKTIIPLIIGSLIVVVPNLIEKYFDMKNKSLSEEKLLKQETYNKLINLLTYTLANKGNDENEEIKKNKDELACIINKIYMTGNELVVENLENYLLSWSKCDEEIQREKFTKLVQAIRLDIGRDKKLNKNFPIIGIKKIS